MNTMEDHGLAPSATPTPAYVPSITQLKDLNLEDSLLRQYHNAETLLAEVLGDRDVPPSQRAQCLNTVSSILSQITKSQSDLYNAERVKKMELALVETLKTLPLEQQNMFLDLYTKALSGE